MALSHSFSRLISKFPSCISSSSLISLGTTSISNYLNRANYSNAAEECPGANKKCMPVARCKIAIVTGGSNGIGLSIIRYLIMNGAKAVIMADVDEERGIQNMQKINSEFGTDKCLFKKTDVTCESEMEELFQCTQNRFHKIDIVVNNAGILADCMWEKTIDINITGLVRGTMLGLQYMGSHNCMGNGGTIINVASILGLQPFYGTPVYVGSKHFIIGFTRSIGHPWIYSLTDVRVMALCPGVTETNMTTEQNMRENSGFKDIGDLGTELVNGLRAMPGQPADECGKCVIHMLKTGKCMDVFVSENKECFKVIIPDRKDWRDSTSLMKDDGCPPPNTVKKAVDECKPKGVPKASDLCSKPKAQKKKDPCKH